MLALLAEEKRKRLDAAMKNREYLISKAKAEIATIESTAVPAPVKRSHSESSATTAMEKLAAGGGGVTSADISALYGAGAKKKKRKGNAGVYIANLPKHLKEVELRIALQRTCERLVGPVRRVKIYHVPNEPGVVKGDALVIFEMTQDAETAIGMLDGHQLQAGYPMSVSKAQFDSDSTKTENPASETQASTVPTGQDNAKPNPFGGKRGDGYQPVPPPQASSDSDAPMNFAPPQAFAEQAQAHAQQISAPPAAPITAQAISATVLLYNVFDPSRELNPYLGRGNELKGIEREMYQELQKLGHVVGFDALQDGSVLVTSVFSTLHDTVLASFTGFASLNVGMSLKILHPADTRRRKKRRNVSIPCMGL